MVARDYECKRCGGSGLVEDPEGRVRHLGSDEVICPDCGGAGVRPAMGATVSNMYGLSGGSNRFSEKLPSAS
jgi:DnaJ-class molecular chaperone